MTKVHIHDFPAEVTSTAWAVTTTPCVAFTKKEDADRFLETFRHVIASGGYKVTEIPVFSSFGPGKSAFKEEHHDPSHS